MDHLARFKNEFIVVNLPLKSINAAIKIYVVIEFTMSMCGYIWALHSSQIERKVSVEIRQKQITLRTDRWKSSQEGGRLLIRQTKSENMPTWLFQFFWIHSNVLNLFLCLRFWDWLTHLLELVGMPCGVAWVRCNWRQLLQLSHLDTVYFPGDFHENFQLFNCQPDIEDQ